MKYQGLDNKIYCLLPEGVSINLIPAGITVRSCAYLYDFAIRLVIMIIIGVALSFLGDVGQGLYLLVYFFMSWGYYIFFESVYGRTPGKKKYNIRIVQDNGLPARLTHIVLRNLLRAADGFPFAYFLGLIVMGSGRNFKRIGDWVAGTLVVFDEESKNIAVSGSTVATAPKFNLSTEEQQAIIAFIERSSEFSTARQAELANILSEKLGVKGEQATKKLKEIAQYYVGQDI